MTLENVSSNHLTYQVLLIKLPNRQAVVLRKCQLAGHKRADPKTMNVLQCLQLAKSLLGSANMVAKKKERIKEKREKGKMTGH